MTEPLWRTVLVQGESWRMKVVTERMIEDKIEQRSEELVRKLREEYKCVITLSPPVGGRETDV